MEFKAGELKAILGGTLIGDSNVVVNNICKIESATTNSVAFLSNEKYISYLYTTNASLILLDSKLENDIKLDQIPKDLSILKLDDPRGAFAKILKHVHDSKNKSKGVHAKAIIGENVSLGEGVHIEAGVVVGDHTKIGDHVRLMAGTVVGENAQIGDHSVIHGSKIYPDSIIGSNCTIQAGAIIGGDGFGFAPNSENNYQKIYHLGNVVIEDHVEVGANTTIDKATIGSTIIKKGVKLDNLIQVAHNVEIGENTVIAAQTGIAGSTVIGRNCMIGGQVGIVGHLKIADGVKIAAQSGIGHSIQEEGAIVQGSPAFKISDYKKSYVLFRRLPDIKRELDKLKKD